MDVTVAGCSITVALIVLASLWVRRHTLRCRWETANTSNVILMGVALVLLAAPGLAFGDWLASWTGLYNLQCYFAELCGVAGLSALAFNANVKLMGDEEFKNWFLTRITLPVGAALCLMFTLFAESRQDETPDSLLFHKPLTDSVAAAHWVVYGVTMLYLLGQCVLAWWYLREPQSKRLINIYMVGAASGATTMVVRIATALVWSWQTHFVTDLMWLTSLGAMGILCFGAAVSWISRVRHFSSHPGWSGYTVPRFASRRRPGARV